MKKPAILLALLLTFGGLTACNAPAEPAPAPTVTVTAEAPTPTVTPEPEPVPSVLSTELTDAEFADYVRANNPEIASVSDATIVSIAKDGCALLESGKTPLQVIQFIGRNATSPAVAKVAGFTFGAGVQNYCPEYEQDVVDTLSNLGAV